jgi:hypothetical protein
MLVPILRISVISLARPLFCWSCNQTRSSIACILIDVLFKRGGFKICSISRAYPVNTVGYGCP